MTESNSPAAGLHCELAHSGVFGLIDATSIDFDLHPRSAWFSHRSATADSESAI